MFDTLKYKTSEGIFCGLSRDEVLRRCVVIAKDKGLKTLRVTKSDAGIVRFAFSIPEALYGSSVHEYKPDDKEYLVAFIVELFAAMEIDTAGIMDCVLTRLDLCRNMCMAASPMLYVSQFARYPKLPHWSRPVYIPPYQAGFRKNDDFWFGCYDKGRKNWKSAPSDMLRWELQLRSTAEIRKVLGISTLGELIDLPRKKAIGCLREEFQLITGENLEPQPATPDIVTLWKLALAKGEKRSAPIFTINYLLSTGQFDPVHLATLRGFLRSALGPNFRHFNDTYLKGCRTGGFDERFRKDVLSRFYEE